MIGMRQMTRYALGSEWFGFRAFRITAPVDNSQYSGSFPRKRLAFSICRTIWGYTWKSTLIPLGGIPSDPGDFPSGILLMIFPVPFSFFFLRLMGLWSIV